MKIIWTLAILLIACGNGQPNVADKPVPDSAANSLKRTNDSIQNPFDHRPLLDFDGSYFKKTDSLKEYIIRVFKNDMEGISTSDIKSIKLSQESLIKNLGKTAVYSITFSDQLPEVAYKNAYLIFDEQKKQAAILFLTGIRFIKLKESDPDYLLSGWYQVRGKGYALVYQFDKAGLFNVIFDSADNTGCENGVPIFNASLDCMSYDPFLLQFSNKDWNSDGLNDLQFKGNINSYCAGLENNTGRNDRKPLKTEQVNIVFQTYQRGDSLYWQLADTSLCRKLNHD